jgi:hypothetical protein
MAIHVFLFLYKQAIDLKAYKCETLRPQSSAVHNDRQKANILVECVLPSIYYLELLLLLSTEILIKE